MFINQKLHTSRTGNGRLAGMAILVLSTTLACSGGGKDETPEVTAPQPQSVTANYVLETYNGQRLPFTAFSGTTFRIILNSGRLQLRADRRYSEQYSADSVVLPSETKIAAPSTDAGTYSLSNSTQLTFTSDGPPVTPYPGTISGTLLTYTFDGALYAWRREQ